VVSRGKPLAMMILDIDYFKAINDTYGTTPGDDVLREFPRCGFARSIRGIDLACRLWRRGIRHRDAGDRPAGGGCGGRAVRRLDRGRNVCSQQGASASRSRFRSGLSILDRKSEAIGDVLKARDTALYRAKHDGRNRW